MELFAIWNLVPGIYLPAGRQGIWNFFKPFRTIINRVLESKRERFDPYGAAF